MTNLGGGVYKIQRRLELPLWDCKEIVLGSLQVLKGPFCSGS